jgi:hypothetical protein
LTDQPVAIEVLRFGAFEQVILQRCIVTRSRPCLRDLLQDTMPGRPADPEHGPTDAQSWVNE